MGEILYIREYRSPNANIALAIDIAMAFSSMVVADMKALEASLREKQLEAKRECDCEQRQAKEVKKKESEFYERLSVLGSFGMVFPGS